jgi:hypothetical protein
MSDHDVGISSLEELFLSREFGHSEEIEGPTWLDELWLAAAFDPGAVTQSGPLEEVFFSRDFGQPLPEDDEDESPVDPDRPGATVLAFTPRDAPARHRAVAALSGVAATVLVVAGVASGSGHPNSPGVSQAQAPRTAPATAGQGSRSAPASPAPSLSSSSTPTPSGNDLGSQPAVLTSFTVSAPQLAVAAAPGTPVTATPPAPATGTGGAPAPAPAPAPVPPPPTTTDPVNAVLVVAGNTVVAAGTTVTTTASQVGAAAPPASSLTSVLGGVGATVSGLGQMLASTSA